MKEEIMSVNKVIILGRLGTEPELKYTPSGAAVCNFSVATSEGWTDKSGQKQEKTEWHRMVVWGKTAELCNQYLSKGRQAYFEGSLQTRMWEKEGQKHYTTEINVRTVQFIGGASTGASQSRDNSNYSQQSSPSQDNSAMSQDYDISTDSNFTSDDIPF